MRLPSVSRNKILEAIYTFDLEYRNTPQFTGWENYEKQKYAISYEGKLYPPKVIISLATGVPRSDFYGGRESNSYLANLGFKIIRLTNGKEITGVEGQRRGFEKQAGMVHKQGVAETSKKENLKILPVEYIPAVYDVLSKLPRYNYYTDSRFLPENGIYFFFEEGEKRKDGGERLVRIGTNKSEGRLKKRLNDHFGGSRDTSVFRKHIGGAIIRKLGLGDKKLKNWYSKEGRADQEIEKLVSRHLKENLSFTCIEVNSRDERLLLEEGLIALFAGEVVEKPSADWLGRYAESKIIRESGLWNIEHVDGKPLTGKQLQRFKELAVGGNPVEENDCRTLVLIPCCKSKVAMLSEGWEKPLPGLPALREQLIDEVEGTLELADLDVNLSGVLNCYATITRAIDLYCGNFYYAAEESLRDVADGEITDVDVLIVSAIYGLVKLNEGIRKYELQMGDTLHDGTKVYKYWQQHGLGKILFDYVSNHNIGYVWSLLPDSMPSFPYQQAFNEFWRLSREKGIECYHVKVPGAGTATGYQRARWLNEVIKTDPRMLVDVNSLPDQFENIQGYRFTYNPC